MDAGYGQWGWGSLPLPASASTLPAWHPHIFMPAPLQGIPRGLCCPWHLPSSRGGFLLASSSFTSSLEGCQNTQEWAEITAIP